MAITLMGAAALFGSIALFEGVAALLESMEGNPEADVQVELQRLAATNQRRAFAQAAVGQAGAEHIDQKFAKFNNIPSRLLSQAALSRMPGPELGGHQDTGLLNMVATRLGVSPRVLNQVSSPSRMGDMGTLYRQMGTSPLTPGQ